MRMRPLAARSPIVLLALVSACTAVRPPAVSEDSDELARAPIPGVTSGAGDTPREATGAPPMAPVRQAPASDVETVVDAGVAAVAPPSPAEPPPEPTVTALGAVGSITTSPDERPLDEGAALDARGQLLWQAIVDDKPELAATFFFPKDAYVHVKAAKNPEGDWKWRLWKNFERDVHAIHKTQGEALRRATFKGLKIPAKKPHWAAPGNEYNRLGYWRVYGAHLVYELRGRERFVPLSSMISWKREWYVVHLTGFR